MLCLSYINEPLLKRVSIIIYCTILAPKQLSILVNEATSARNNQHSKASLKEIWCIKTVPEITTSLFFLKFVRYGKLLI